jgi:glycosyltransferase involved in cell wall biosynthesis
MGTDGVALSVVIPLYNAGGTIARALASLAHVAPGDRPRTQVVVVNDGSTDDGPEIVRRHAAEGGFRWTLIDQPNRGVSAARNAGLAAAVGEYLLFLDADDELAFNPVPVAAAHRAFTCVGLSVEYRRGNRRRSVRPVRLTSGTWADTLTARCPFAVSALLFRRDCVDCPFDETIRYTEDWLFWMRNPRLYDNMVVLPAVTGSVIHVRVRSAGSNYEAWGADRARAARQVRECYAGRLTRRQRNNLDVQERIGALQQRRWVPVGTFLRFPCDPVLYAKLWVYALAAALNRRASHYPTHATARPAETRP